MSPSTTCRRHVRPVEITLYLVSGDLSISDDRSTPVKWQTRLVSRGSCQWYRSVRLAVQRNEDHDAGLISPPVVGRRLRLTLDLVHNKQVNFPKIMLSLLQLWSGRKITRMILFINYVFWPHTWYVGIR